MSRPTLFLIDGSSQMYRAYHAFRGRGLSNQEGQTTHAVYVFVTMLRKLIAYHKPAYIAASFDLAGPTFRDQIVDDYKANRVAMPDELKEQIDWVHQACEALGVPIVTAQGYEADDVIGTLATRAEAGGFEVSVVSIDKDFFQLVREGIRALLALVPDMSLVGEAKDGAETLDLGGQAGAVIAVGAGQQCL